MAETYWRSSRFARAGEGEIGGDLVGNLLVWSDVAPPGNRASLRLHCQSKLLSVFLE
jgi:hypothetical protein